VRRASRIALAAIVLLAGPAWADPPKIKLPPEVKVLPGGFIVLRPETDAHSVRWVCTQAGVGILPGDLLTDQRALVATALPGRYTFAAVAASATGDQADPVFCVVQVGEPPPPEPPPSPDEPDAELPPVGSGVTKSDPLRAAPDVDKAAVVRGLSYAWRQGADVSQNLQIRTVGDLYSAFRKLAIDQGASQRMKPLQTLMVIELQAKIGMYADIPMTPELRAASRRECLRLSAIYGALK
jgi:hypothetical protein